MSEKDYYNRNHLQREREKKKVWTCHFLNVRRLYMHDKLTGPDFKINLGSSLFFSLSLSKNILYNIYYITYL